MHYQRLDSGNSMNKHDRTFYKMFLKEKKNIATYHLS